MGEYKCSKCGAIDNCPSNTSGYGVCPKCTPGFIKDLDEMPRSGKIDEIPEKYKYMFWGIGH